MMTAPEPDGIVWHTSSYSYGHGNCVQVGWRTSSYSCGNGDCVQVGWRTSSYSCGNGDCVQVAPAADRVLVRDSKHPEGPALTLPTPAWQAFLTTLTP
ncbi:MAG: DUF397 domain-containing protein [Pseudonocardiaceae bacterium]